MRKENNHIPAPDNYTDSHGGIPRFSYEERLGNFEEEYTPAPFYNGNKDHVVPTRSRNMQAWVRLRKDMYLKRG